MFTETTVLARQRYYLRFKGHTLVMARCTWKTAILGDNISIKAFKTPVPNIDCLLLVIRGRS